MKWPVNQSQNCFNKRNLRGKLAKLDDFKGPYIFWSCLMVIDGVNCLEIWLSPQISWFRWPGESPGRRCMSEVKPGELSITNLAIRSWDPVLWCNFVWVCLGWRKFTFHMDDSNLPYDRFIWIWQRFHKSSTQFPSSTDLSSAPTKCQNAEPLEPLQCCVSPSGLGTVPISPGGTGWRRCCFSWPCGWDALGSASGGEGPSDEKWMVSSNLQRNNIFSKQPMAREPNRFGIDDNLCLYVDDIVYTLFW